MLRAWLVAALLLAGAGLALAGPRVRITLRDGSTVEGELVDYGARRYQVTTAGGARREVAEGDVRSVTFLGELPPTAVRVLGRALRAAEASGALEALLGEHPLCVREAGFAREELLGDDDPGPLASRVVQALLRLRVARIGPDGLRVRVDALPAAPGVELRTLGLGALPAAVEAEVGLDGALRALRHVGPGCAAARLLQHDDQTLPEVLVVALLAPLVEHGVPDALAVRLLRPDGVDDAASSLEVLPADRAARVREVRLTPPASALAPTLDLRVGLRGADRGRLLGWRGRTPREGASEAALDVEVDRLTPAAWEERRVAWGAPELAPEPVAAGSPGPLGELLKQAEASGRLDALLAAVGQEGLLRWESPGRAPRAARVRARRAPGGLRVDVTLQETNRSRTLGLSYALTSAGGLRWLRAVELGRSDGALAELVAGARGLEGRARWSPGSAWRAVTLDAAAVPAALAALFAGRPGALPGAVEVVDEASLGSPLGPDVRPLPASEVAPATAAELAALGRAWRSGEGAAAVVDALRRVAAAQSARVARGEPPAPTVADLGAEAPARLAGHQLEVRVVDGRWAAFAVPLDTGVDRVLGLGPDGVLREGWGSTLRDLADGADLLEALRPAR